MARVSPSSRLGATAIVGALVVLYALGSSGSTSPGSSSPNDVAAGSTPSDSLEPSSAATSEEPTPASTATPSPTPTPRPTTAACTPTDQDRYVYHPSRLEVLRTCVRVTGTIAAVRHEADGDLHILLALDSRYRSLLRPANQGEELGDLVIEPVCVEGVTQADAIDVCASDHDPLSGPFPTVGEHVWMEGRYVLDLDHNGWAELHPLFRWGG
jgi:hypothetical protein